MRFGSATPDLPSNGQPKGRFASFGLPLMSNGSAHGGLEDAGEVPMSLGAAALQGKWESDPRKGR